MKIMVTGANGLLGQHLVDLLLSAGSTVIATGKASSRLPSYSPGTCRYYPADLTDKTELENILRIEQPSVIVHAGAMTQVDDCELWQEQSFAVNVTGTDNLLTAADRYNSHFIYISTDFVFDGKKGKYTEGDGRNPVNFYGHTKQVAERKVEDSELPWAIVRTGLVYGSPLRGARSNIVTWVKDNLEQGQKIKVVSDQVRTPTYVGDLAAGILLMIEREALGPFHIAGREIMTPYEIAMKTAVFFGLDGDLVEKVDASSFSQLGKRPLRTDLVTGLAKKELDYDPLPFEKGLGKMFS